MKLLKDSTIDELDYWFHAPFKELGLLFSQARSTTDRYFNREIQVFVPGSHFPAISITGKECQLHCLHCGGRFLNQMKSITSPSELRSFCHDLFQNKGIGCLISGGCDSQGSVPLTPFIPAIAQIKQTTSLFINVHTGFLSEAEAQLLAETEIDCASVDVVGDDAIIHGIYGLTNRSVQDYTNTLEALSRLNVPIAPHICVGLHNGQLSSELDALKLIKNSIDPTVLVIIALMPSKDTAMEMFDPPSNTDIARVCALARLLFPTSEVALGCMRPRGTTRREMERLAIEAGVTRIALPTKSTLNYLQENGYITSKEDACCVVTPSIKANVKT